MEEQKIYDCIIVGGSISGLSFAHYLTKEKQDILILEQEDRIGGQILTQKSGETDFWCELGAHTCYNSYRHLLGIVKDLHIEDSIKQTNKLSYVIYAKNKIKSVFSQLKLLSMATHFPRIFFADKTGKTVKEYFEPIVGKSNYIPLFSNLFRAVISQDADEYPADIFLKKREVRLKDFPRKYTFQEGLQSFLDQIIAKNKFTIQYGTSVNTISSTDGVITVDAGSATYLTRKIAVATDAQTASRLIRNLNPHAAEILSDVELSQSETLSIVISKDKLDLKKIAGIIPMGNEFTSVVSRDTVDDEEYRAMVFHFEEAKQTTDEQLETACKVLNIDKSDVLYHSQAKHILPALKVKNVGLTEQIDKLAEKNIYLLGNYYLGLSLEDCVHRSHSEYERYQKNLNG